MRQVTTLSLIGDEKRVLLAMKKRGFGVGLWNGYGGKVGADETIEEAMIRELQEESGILATEYRARAVLEFIFKDTGGEVEMHIFEVTGYEGEPIETEEMSPKWFLKEGVPFDTMWPDDKEWMPLFFDGKDFDGRAVFSGDSNEMVESEFIVRETKEGKDFGHTLGEDKLG